ncbi:MAG: threonylcarbamoyl-AMP synthase [Gammaproteobacteria bacterium]|nr:threonylcarbamoyl-AMP synthase [Gammaproteobacteria bacterium]
MLRYLEIHTQNPQARLIQQAVEAVRDGAVLVYPTDSGYALGCHLGDKAAVDRIRALRELDDKHNLTLVCRDLSEIATYAQVDNQAYRLLKSLTPGPYTFILDATREVPRRLQHPKRKTIGIRVPGHPIVDALLDVLGEPLISTTLQMPGDEQPLTDPQEIKERLRHQVNVIIDGGAGSAEPTTIVDLTGPVPMVLRKGRGDTHMFE